MKMLDVLIVGGGPAGLSAALVLGRCRRNVVLCDAGRPRNSRSIGVHGFLTRDGIEPAELRRIGREQLCRYSTVRVHEGLVIDIDNRHGHFEAMLADGTRMVGRKLLLAPGIEPDLPSIDGVAELYGRGVFDCPYCDGWEVRDKPIAVYGQGNRAKKFALQLFGWSSDVVLCTDGPSDLAEQDKRELEAAGVDVVEDRIEKLEGTGSVLSRISLSNGKSLSRQALFFIAGPPKPSPLLRKLGCIPDDRGTVETGRYETTRVPGLYVAGDASRRVDFAIVAAAEGAMAAFSINRELLDNSSLRGGHQSS